MQMRIPISVKSKPAKKLDKQRNKGKQKNKTNKKPEKPHFSVFAFSLPVLFFLVALEAAVYHAVYSLAPLQLFIV